MEWTVETLNETVDRELSALPADMRARFSRICGLISAVGLERMGAPHVRHLAGPLWEMRMTGRDGISRALYVTAHGRARRGGARLREEDATHTEARDRIGAAPRRGDGEMTKVSELHREWSKDPEYREAYERLGAEFALARTLIEARRSAALTQAELAERMETTQSVVARLESGRIHPSTRTLEKVARATGTRLRISFDPA